MANFWLHNGYVTSDGEKMSKSLGNFTTINELLFHFDGEAIRYALLQAHYRAPLSFSKKSFIIKPQCKDGRKGLQKSRKNLRLFK